MDVVDKLDRLVENAAYAIVQLIEAAQYHTTTGTKDMTVAIMLGTKAVNAVFDEYNNRDERVVS